MFVVSVVCCQVEISATSWSLVQRSPINCGASVVCDLKTSRMRRPWPTFGRSATTKKKGTFKNRRQNVATGPNTDSSI